MSIIKIKRSSGTIAPTALALGEFGYTYGAGTQANGGDRLYLGTGGESAGVANAIDVIGGKYFADLADHAHGTLTASSAIIVDSNSKIDVLNIDNLTIDGNTITSTDTNGNIELTANGLGTIELNSPVNFAGATTFTGLLNADGGIAVDTNAFTVAGDGTGNTLIGGTLGVTGESTLASAIVSDLTDNRVVIAGTSGALEDDANFTFDGTTLALTSDFTQTGTGTVTGQWNVDNLRLDGNVLSTTDTNGNLTLTPNGTGYVVISGTNGLVIPVGTNAQQGPAVNGAIRLNSTSGQFEGYSNANWSSLGGVRSVDGLTFIIAETSPGNSDDTLHFYVATGASTNKEAMTLDEDTLAVLNTTTSTSTSTGAVTVAGGVGITENLNVGGDTVLTGDLAVNGGDITTTATTFNLVNATATTLNIGGAATAVDIGATTGTTSVNNALSVDGNFDVGGASIFTVNATSGNTETAGNLIVGGDLTVNGTTTSVNVDVLDVEDALIRLASGNTSDSVDIGIVGRYNDGTNDQFAGLFRDATAGEWHLFDEYIDTDLTDNVVNMSDASFSLANLNLDVIKFTQQSFTLTGDVAGTINISDFGSTAHSIATTIQPNSVALGNDTTGDYVQEIDEGANVTGATAGSNAQTSIYVTGTGESAVVTVQAVIADQVGQVGVATFDALSNGAGTNRNFDVSASGSVSINTIDGGTF
jgi:hypothetical protein